MAIYEQCEQFASDVNLLLGDVTPDDMISELRRRLQEQDKERA